MSVQAGTGGPGAAGDRTAWARNLAAPVRDFLSTESGGAVVLLGAAVAALLWANSPWSDSYESFWTTKLSIRVGGEGISMDLRHWVNEGLMTFFFLVVGLEAKRELDMGELRERRRLAIPVVAAAGGITLPIAIYLAFNAGGPGGARLGSRDVHRHRLRARRAGAGGPRGTRLRVRLLTLAVVDDLVALLVIATVYTDHLSLVPLAVAVGLFGMLFALRYAPVAWRRQAAVILGVAVWVALFESGIDPIIAGLAVGLVTSAYPPARGDLERVTELTALVPRAAHAELARSAQLSVASAISANERLQYRLHPWTSFVIVPLFALANAGIHVDGQLLGDAVTSPDHARDPVRLRGRQAARHPRRDLARIALLARRPAPGAELAGDRRRRGRGRHRLHRLAADLEPRLPRAAARGGQARRPRQRRSWRRSWPGAFFALWGGCRPR